MSQYVDLSEKVTATFYDQECEEWTQQTVTVADVLDSVCDDYTVLPSAEDDGQRIWVCTRDERRPCYVDEKKAIFHRWVEVREMLSRGLTVMNDHPGGIVADVLGLVEYEDGRISKVRPEKIRFVDGGDFACFREVI